MIRYYWKGRFQRIHHWKIFRGGNIDLHIFNISSPLNPDRFYPPIKSPVTNEQEAEWAPEWLWKREERKIYCPFSNQNLTHRTCAKTVVSSLPIADP
jgi:hypothetical protein